MSEPYLSEIRMAGFTFAPRGWAQCDGQILPINQNQSLYSLLGTTYGGDGRTSFALPDLRGRTPIHRGNSQTTGSSDHNQGQKGGMETVTLSAEQMPQHTHSLQGSSDNATANNPGSNVFAKAAFQLYRNDPTTVAMRTGSVENTGGSGHNNLQPYQVVNFLIALLGVFPSRN